MTTDRHYKVLDLDAALSTTIPRHSVLVRLEQSERLAGQTLISSGFAGILADQQLDGLPGLYAAEDLRVIGPGDVIRLGSADRVRVLYRRQAPSNWLFATERCNSNCLMCSQPPRDVDDSWRIEELKSLVALIDPELAHLGITGGEPTLLESGLVGILDQCARSLPATNIHILSNGRGFSSDQFAGLFQRHADRITWAIPLYSDIAGQHDRVVGAVGAYDETINGLFNLGERGFHVELRVVLHALTVPRLEALSRFICRNLPFVSHVAFMGLEPMGYAKRNMGELWIDPIEYGATLQSAIEWVDANRIRASIYNLPLCILPSRIRRFAKRSISDWKNVFLDQCGNCSARDECSGFFSSAGVTWISKAVAPFHGSTQ